jgi:type VI secretion system secreted protein VgrG
VSTHPITARVEIQLSGDRVQTLTALRLSGREEIGTCFELRIVATMAAKDLDDRLDAGAACGSRCTVYVERVDHTGVNVVLRQVHGIIASIDDHLEIRSDHATFDVVVVPRLWELSNVVTQGIFVGLSAPDVIRAKLEAAGLVEDTDFELRLTDEAAYQVPGADLPDRHTDGAKPPTPARDRLIVQYRESDLAFVSRLAEHEGISFFFEHDGDRDVVVFCDNPTGFSSTDDAVPYSSSGDHGSIRNVVRRTRSVPSTVFVLDYNYRAPDLTYSNQSGELVFETLGSRADLDAPTPGTIVEYAANLKSQLEADRLAAVRADEQGSLRDRLIGTSDLPGLAAGARITVDKHPALTAPANDVILVAITHALATGDGGKSGHGESAEYTNTFEAVQSERTVTAGGRVATYRPPRRTPKPRIHGFLTGVVRAVGQIDHVPGDLAARQHIDVEGRYLIRLHFDQGGEVMPPVRMAQPHAGASYGMHFPLHPGVEVVVAFLDGDPDRPIILGAVANPLHRSPVHQETSSEVEALLHMNEMNRIQTRSGIIIQLGDGDPPVVPASTTTP